ncbi:MAG: hypothetical protein B7Y45_00300 [Sphingomonas sp. 28-66-16]|nr:MAG: hypothetical protein B7Y45_00300 [Sphingomonas sp. 28-66-16]
MTSDEEGDAFQFTSDWRGFAPIAFSNLLLCFVTLGLYLFWARARERRFLWSNTRFIDDRLEWTGTGLELMIGYVMAIILLGVPLAVLQFGMQALALRGELGWVATIGSSLYLLILYLVGVAIFRALRYRLSRTFWHGIRGGSDAQGFAFGVGYLWRTLVGSFAAGLLIPWSMTSLWNARWNQMSFGPLRFEADARAGPIMGRFLLFYLTPILALIAIGVLFFFTASSDIGRATLSPDRIQLYAAVVAIAAYLLFFVVLGIIALVFYAAYFREAVGHLSLGELDFAFTASSWDWFKLVVGNLLLITVTLGIGYIFIGYRNWTFFIRHIRAYGSIHLDDLTQSTTREPGQGEGLLDAFDIGAF